MGRARLAGVLLLAQACDPAAAHRPMPRARFQKSALCLFCAAALGPPRPASAVVIRQADPKWQPAGDPSDPRSYFAQLRAGRDELRRCLRDWVKITRADGDTDYDGDAVRRIIGTVGTASPLLNLERVLDKVRRGILADPEGVFDKVDVEEFVELAQEVVQGLRDVDLLAYSAIFADPSGNAGVPGQSSKAYLGKTKAALEKTAEDYDRLLRVLGVD